MAFSIPDIGDIRTALLRDIRSLLPDADTGADSDYFIRASSVASAVEGLYQHQSWILRQIFPDTCDSDYLERHASLRKLSRKAATVAAGAIAFSGVPGSGIPVGTEIKRPDGISFVTTTSAVLDSAGTAVVVAQAATTGSSGNTVNGASLILSAAPSGIYSTATVVSMSGGTDIETDASLLSRLLFRLRNPPCGGAAHDYYSWAMDVDGVTAAYVYPNRRGLGTTDVVIMTDGGIPPTSLVGAAQSSIDKVRPVQADFLCFGPSAITVNVTGTLILATGYALSDVRAAISAALGAYFSGLKPGEAVYLNRIRAIIADVPGVLDFSLTLPTANIVALVDATHTELAVLGTVNLS
jgi:uncharacterized phage protein gp47/JayE